MGKLTSTTDRRGIARRGYTLVEAMIASTLLSVTVVAVSGAISASYAQDQYAAQRRAALESGSQLLDEISALPMQSDVPTDPSIVMYNNYTDEAVADELQSVVGTPTAVTSSAAKKAKRTVKVRRKASLNGADSATGDFAIIGITVENGDEAIQVQRLVTSAESAATN